MNLINFAAALSVGFAGTAFAADGHDHGHAHKPLHGGIVTEVKDVDYELVAKPRAHSVAPSRPRQSRSMYRRSAPSRPCFQHGEAGN